MLQDVTHSLFAGRVGEPFRIGRSADGIDVALVSARTWGESSAGRGRVPFTLLFRGPATPVLPQGTYPFEHAELGTMEMFVVPVGPDGGGMGYEVVFS